MERRAYAVPGGHLSALHFGRTTNPLKLVFCHANGFNAQSYRAVLEPLGVHAVALDMRGHGLTGLPTDAENLRNWHVFAGDIAAFFDAHVSRPVTLAGHSFGAVSAVLSLPRTRDKVHGYCGFDPVLVPGALRAVAQFSWGREWIKQRLPIARRAGERGAVFGSVDAAVARYSGRGAFRDVPEAVLRDYVVGGTVPRLAGGVRLACEPAWEQAIFAAQAHNVFRAARLLPDASRIVFAGKRGAVSSKGTRAAIQKAQSNISVEFEPDRTHLFPLEDPAYAAGLLHSVMQQAALELRPQTPAAPPSGRGSAR